MAQAMDLMIAKQLNAAGSQLMSRHLSAASVTIEHLLRLGDENVGGHGGCCVQG